GIMAAKKKPLERLDLADLGLSASDVSPAQEVVELNTAEERRSTEMIPDDGQGAAAVAAFLRRVKVI
ncbi:MAG TPA: electron transfer flavoprotein subunit alpha, partial [Actinomycetota bacterium]|nr:electron transfer flavoprotein subunit alpha [Actinomycetota bacterium]